MPRVPVYESNTVGQSGLATNGYQPAQTIDTTSGQTRQLGQALMQGGELLNKIGIDRANDANRLRIDDATNQTKEAILKLRYDQNDGYENKRGAATLPQDGQAFSDTYAQKLRAKMDEIRGGLSSDAQKEAYDVWANATHTEFTGQLMAHEDHEHRAWMNSVDDGTIKNRADEISLRYDSPDSINSAINGKYVNGILVEKGIVDAITDRGHRAGLSAEEINNAVGDAKSNAYLMAVGAALNNGKTAYAKDLLEQFGKDMRPADTMKYHAMISDKMDVDAGTVFGNSVHEAKDQQAEVKGSPLTGIARVIPIIESNNKQLLPNGEPVTSKTGAIGKWQVMPATAKEMARLIGVPWDEHAYKYDEKYNEALGVAYITQQVKYFAGDEEKALAAYNCGPGGVNKAVKKAEAAKQQLAALMQQQQDASKIPGSTALTGNAFADTVINTRKEKNAATQAQIDALKKQTDWRNNLPLETQGYIAKGRKLVEADGGDTGGAGVEAYTKTLRSPAPPSLEDTLTTMRQHYPPNASALFIKSAEEAATRSNKMAQDGYKTKQEDAYAAAVDHVFVQGKSFLQIPADQRALIAPEKVPGLMKASEDNAQGKKVVTDPTLYVNYVSHPEKLAELTDTQFITLKTALSDSDFNQITKIRANQINTKSGKGSKDNPEQIDDKSLGSVFNGLFASSGVKSPHDKAEYLRIARETILSQQISAGRRFTDKELSDRVNGVFMAEFKKSVTHWFGKDTTEPVKVIGLKFSDIPSADVEAMRAAFKKRGLNAVTENDILHAYKTQLLTK